MNLKTLSYSTDQNEELTRDGFMEALRSMGLIEDSYCDTEIVTTIGLYLNESYLFNGVQLDGLYDHYKYNFLMRPGRAFFINGVCFISGYFGDRAKAQYVFDNLERKPGNIKMTYDTRPYR